MTGAVEPVIGEFDRDKARRLERTFDAAGTNTGGELSVVRGRLSDADRSRLTVFALGVRAKQRQDEEGAGGAGRRRQRRSRTREPIAKHAS